MVHVIAQNKIKPECVDEFLALAAELVTLTNKEVGCVEYGLHRGVTDDSIFTILERWETQAHLDAHCKTEHFLRICPQFAPLVARPGSVTVLERSEVS